MPVRYANPARVTASRHADYGDGADDPVPLRGHHPEYVFTHVAQRARGKRRKGELYPLNASTAIKAWFKLRAAAKVTGFRFHDFRHDVGTKVLRVTGNLKITQQVRTIATSGPPYATRTCSTAR